MEDKKESKFIKYYDKYMICAGVMGQYLFYTQAYKIFTTKSVNDLALDGFIVIFFSTLSWMVYGILHKNIPIIITQIFAITGMSLVLIGIMLYST